MRRKTILLTAALLALATTEASAQAKRFDTNGDGRVDIQDVTAVVNFIMSDDNVAYTECPDDHHPHLIDLGLPSGTKWACCNVGASKPEAYGGYYAWGETAEKRTYDWSTYKYGNSAEDVRNIGSVIAGTKYDVATDSWLAPWFMPTAVQLRELMDKCTKECTKQNNVSGFKFTGPNGASIFLPAAGEYGEYGESYMGWGHYWSSTLDKDFAAGAFAMTFDDSDPVITSLKRTDGMTVRPVRKDLCPDAHHPHLIDLGLPSGTKWACCNVGADKPEAYGGYYAWGETEEKSDYTWDTYQYGRSSSDVDDIGSDIAGTDYDVAHVKWGDSWVMPSLEQMLELRDNTTSVWTTQNGVNGRKFICSNGGAVFLPAAGYRSRSYLHEQGMRGYYWESTLIKSDMGTYPGAVLFNWNSYWYSNPRYEGISVRPVCNE